MAKKKTLKDINEALRIGSVMLCFHLQLNTEHWGTYRKGDMLKTHINLLDEDNGLARFGIEKHWTIISCEFVNKA